MGWTFYPTPPRHERAEIMNLFTWKSDKFTTKVLALSKVSSIWFAAVKFTPRPGEDIKSGHYTSDPDGSFTWCAVFLTERCNGEWGYKDLTESMGPASPYCRCPAGVLKHLSPTNCDYALQFRAASVIWNNRPKPKPGQTIKTSRMLSFSNGAYDTFTRQPTKQGNMIFRTYPGGALVRLRGQDLLGAEFVT